jgi:drug/metabolite transporter (DMT)-like permease
MSGAAAIGPAGAYVFLALAFSLAGSSVIPGKVLSGLPPFAAAAGSAAVGLIALLPFAAREKGPARGTVGRALPLLAAQALFGMALFRVLLFAALARTSAAEVGVATSATPAITALLAAVFLKERIGGRKALGIAAVVAGVALLEASPGAAATGQGAAASAGRLAGLALALGAAASESVFNVMSKRLPQELGPTRTSAAVTALAFAMLAALSLATGERIRAADLSSARLAAFAYYGVFASALAYLCWYKGIKKVPASTAGTFSGFMPLSGFGLSILIFGERPGALGVAGAVLALAGMTLCTAGGRVKAPDRCSSSAT